jgi:RNA polymerase-binding transcription factor DksA
MTETRRRQFREQLEELARRLKGDIGSLEDQARVGVGGAAGGDLSNVPMHLGDLGSEQYHQELNSTLLANEAYLRREVLDALERWDRGTFGTCERCGKPILAARLKALPYTRYCTACAAVVQDGLDVNLNDGRPDGGLGDFERRHGAGEGFQGGTESERIDQEAPFTKLHPNRGNPDAEDVHAAGSAGGGTAVGGLAGTNIGEGDPDDGDIENAMGSGNFDVTLEADDDDTTAYSGPSGGAVGGTPAEKRAGGGQTGGGLAPQPGPGDSPTGP